jgi:ATP-dependent exoDNAse (exonuclease V) alpha subunit
MGAGARAARPQGCARRGRGRYDRLAPDGAGAVPGTRRGREGRAGRRPRAVAGASFRSVTERHGAAEITEIRRQREDWQRDATRALATGRTGEAIHAYDGKGMVHAADTRKQARGELVDAWDRARQAEPGNSRIILTHTNAEVQSLNGEARERRSWRRRDGEGRARRAAVRERRSHHVPSQRTRHGGQERHARHDRAGVARGDVGAPR